LMKRDSDRKSICVTGALCRCAFATRSLSFCRRVINL
jgi:hypothetical protein